MYPALSYGSFVTIWLVNNLAELVDGRTLYVRRKEQGINPLAPEFSFKF
jgi:hypothetical protein